MTQCFAFLCSDAALLDVAHEPFASALSPRDEAPDGWGLAYYQNNQPLLRKHPRAVTGSLGFADMARSLRSAMLLGQTRPHGQEPKTNDNTPPFRYRGWTFVLGGGFSLPDEARLKLSDSIPDFIKRNIKGRSDVELVFHVFLSFLNDTGKLEDPRIPAALAGRALDASMIFIASVLGTDADPYCCLASNGSILLAQHKGMPLSLARKSSYTAVDTTPNDRPISHPNLRAVAMVGGKPITEPGWETVAESAVLVASRNLDIEMLPPFD